MGRGGGVVSGSKHSVSHDHHHGGGGGSSNPFCTGLTLIIAGVIFLILAVAIPIAMVISPAGDPCSPSDSINRNEQMVCIPDDLEQTWVAEYASKGKDYTKVYKVDNTTLRTTTREYLWKNYEVDLKGQYTYFSMSAPLDISGWFWVYCEGKKCEDLKMYFLNKEEFDASVDSSGEFHEKRFRYDWKDFGDDNTYYFPFNTTGVSSKNEVWYLVFSNKKNKHVTITYDIQIEYTVYDMSLETPITCEDNKCKFDDLKQNEIIVMDFISGSNSGDCRNPGSVPEYFDARMHNTRISLTGVVAVAAIFGILAIASFLIGVCFIIRCL